METASTSTVTVRPGVQHYHPSALKSWGAITLPTTVLTSYPASGVSVTHPSTGQCVVTHGRVFSTSTYPISVEILDSGTNALHQVIARTVSTFTVSFTTPDNVVIGQLNPFDVAGFMYMIAGDLP